MLYEAAFAGCTSLTAIELPDTLEALGNLVFSGCTALKDITIPASLREFGEPALDDTQWMKDQQALNPYVAINGILINTQLVSGDAVIPAEITEIGAYAFCGSDEITSVTIPEGVTALRRCAATRQSGIINRSMRPSPRTAERARASIPLSSWRRPT